MTDRKAPHLVVHPGGIRVVVDAAAVVDDAVAGDLRDARLHQTVRDLLRQVSKRTDCTVLVDPVKDDCS